MAIVERVEEGAVLVITLDGPLEIGNESKKLEWLVKERVKDGRRKVVVDLARVPYIDSAGIGVMVASLSNVSRAGGELRVSGANEFVRGILKKTGVDGILGLDATVADSVATLTGPADDSR